MASRDDFKEERAREKQRERNKYEGRIEGREGGRAVGHRGCKLLRQLLERWARTVWHIDHAGVSTSCLKIRLNERSEDMRERDGGEGRAGELKQFAIKITSGREEEEEEAASFFLQHQENCSRVSAHASPL